MSFFEELKRRNVFRVAAAYVVASWLLLQVIDVVFPILELPNWVSKLVLLLLATGFLVAVIFSWAYEMTPEGLKRESEVQRDTSITHQTARKLDRITIALLLLVAALVIYDRMTPETVEPATMDNAEPAAGEVVSPTHGTARIADSGRPDDDRQSVAVIPFVNMSDDESNEYFSDGISEELLNALVRIETLRVPSRTSSFTFKDSNKKLAEIGRELNVAHVLEGSVRKAGNRIRVTAQLIEVETDTHLWSETYTRELDDIFAVQDEIAQAIVNALQQELSDADQQSLAAHSTDNVAAYNEYLLGRHYWHQRNAEPLRAAERHLRMAVELDPNYAQAWAALATVYLAGPEYAAATIEDWIPLSVKASERALELNPNSAEALANRAYYRANYLFDWDGANADFRRAIKLEPGNASLHHWYGLVLNIQLQLDEALEQLGIARELDPLSPVIRHVPGYFLMFRNRLDEAEAHYMDSLALGNPIMWTYQNLDILNCLRGNWDEARKYARKFAELLGTDPTADLARIDAMENPELTPRALELLKARTDIGDQIFGKAMQYALLKEWESAMVTIERAFADGDGYASNINYLGVLDPIRDDPRFQALLKQMNLAK